MCEDPATRPKGNGVRAGRVENIRMRIRSAQQNRQSPPTQRSPSLPENVEPGSRPTSPLPGAHIPNNINSAYIPERYHEIYPQRGEDPWYRHRTVQQTRRDSLIEIAMRTILLLRQNKLLLRKVADLEKETRVFMRSVTNNQQNRNIHICQQNANQVPFNCGPAVVNFLPLHQSPLINRQLLAVNARLPSINHQPQKFCLHQNHQPCLPVIPSPSIHGIKLEKN